MRKIRRTVTVLAAATLASLAIAAVASAHAAVSPPVALANVGQLFSLAVPTEKEGLTTTRIELTPPKDFSIDSFAPAPGWKSEVQQTGSGEEARRQQGERGATKCMHSMSPWGKGRW